MVFGFLMGLVSVASGVLMILIIMKGINRAQEIRQQMYMKTLEKGIYDYRLIGGKPSTGTAVLGWGIFFAAVGLALLISFIALGIFGEATPGALIPLFVGIGLVIYYFIRRNIAGEVTTNGDPVRFDPPSGDGPPKIAGE